MHRQCLGLCCQDVGIVLMDMDIVLTGDLRKRHHSLVTGRNKYIGVTGHTFSVASALAAGDVSWMNGSSQLCYLKPYNCRVYFLAETPTQGEVCSPQGGSDGGNTFCSVNITGTRIRTPEPWTRPGKMLQRLPKEEVCREGADHSSGNGAGQGNRLWLFLALFEGLWVKQLKWNISGVF